MNRNISIFKVFTKCIHCPPVENHSPLLKSLVETTSRLEGENKSLGGVTDRRCCQCDATNLNVGV